ncbi:MAG: succinyl-diaminopimelate desuccinylase [Planctomycetota bacterium]
MSGEPTELERLCLALLAIPSPIGSEGLVADFCEAYLREKGCYGLTRSGDNLAFQPRPFRPGHPRLLLLGHLDTVPPADDNPARLEGDRILGLGASDMKCADAVILSLAAEAVAREPELDLACVLYAAEEGPYAGSGMPEILAAAPGCFDGVDLAIAMEPTDNELELGCLGTLHAVVRFEGKRAHSARPWQGRNAIHMAGPLLTGIAAIEPRTVTLHGLEFREVISATQIDYEGARNVVPGACTVNLNFRFGPDREPEEAVDHVVRLVAEANAAAGIDPEHVSVEVPDLCPSGKVCGDNALLARLRGAAPRPLETRAKQAWTDVGRLSQMGLDALNYGPGSPAQAHQVGEHALRAKVAESREVLGRLLFGRA